MHLFTFITHLVLLFAFIGSVIIMSQNLKTNILLKLIKQMHEDQKKQIYIGPTIQHIQNCDFLIKNANELLLLNKRQVLLLNLQSQSLVTSKIDTEKISSTTFHDLLSVYLLKTPTDIFVINQTGESLGKLSLKEQNALIKSKFIFISPMKNGQCEDPHQRIDQLIYITEENLHISHVKIKFQRAILKNKRIINFSLELLKKQAKNGIDPSIIFDAPQWIEKCKFFKQLGYFVCYNKKQLMVFKFPKLTNQTIEHYLTYRKTSKTQNYITDVAISNRQKQIIFGHESGTIKIYRFNQTKKYLQELRGHQKQCHSLFISQKNSNDILYSSGADNTIRLWNLYGFEEIYSLRVDLICDKILLLSDELAFVKFSEQRKSCLCKLNAYKMEPMMTENKGGKIISLKCDGEWGIALYSNNYAEMFLIGNDEPQQNHVDPLQDVNENKSKKYIEKIQFPMKYGNVRSAQKLKQNHYAIILEKGFSMIVLDKDEVVSENFELKKLVYNQEVAHLKEDSEVDESDIDEMYDVQEDLSHNKKEVPKKFVQTQQSPQKEQKNDDRFVELIHEKLLGTYLFGILQDWKGIPTAINVTFVTFVIGKAVPMWDLDQKKKGPQKDPENKLQKSRKRKKSLIPEQQPINVEQMIHVVLGTDRGVIFIVNIQNRTQFQSRIVVHTQQIEYVKEFFPKKASYHTNEEIFFMSLDRNREFCFWSISQHRPPNIYCRVTNNRNISHISLHDSFLLIGEKQGKISILQLIYEDERSDQRSDFLKPSSSFRTKQSHFSSRDSSAVHSSKIYFKITKNDSIDGHMKTVTAGDHINYKGKDLFLTGSQDCTIKLWLGLQKILLFELKIFETIEHLRFAFNGIDFLMAHNNQISVIKGQNIDEIKEIDSDLNTKYDSLLGFNFRAIQIKSFFMKENELIQSQLKKPSQFRLKMRNSLKSDSTNSLTDQSSNKAPTLGLGPKQGFKLSSIPMKIIDEQPKNKIETSQKEGEFITKIDQKQSQKPKHFSLDKKILADSSKEKRMKVYAKSEEKIRAKKSFHIVSTAQSKEYNEALLMLPKIPINSQMNIAKKKVATSFQISSLMDELKTQRQKAFSYLGRYSKT